MIDNNLIHANTCQAQLKVIREDKSQVEFPRRFKTSTGSSYKDMFKRPI